MMYPYMTLGDGTEVAYSEPFKEDGVSKVLVHFERPTAQGFDSIRCELPSYTWTVWEGSYSPEEVARFDRFVRNNAHLLYRYAATGDSALPSSEGCF